MSLIGRAFPRSLLRTLCALIPAIACSNAGNKPSTESSDESLKARETKLYAVTDTMGALPVSHRAIAVTAREGLVENSGVAMSGEQPGVLFTINDSGNEPVLFALDTTGADRGAWRISNAPNVDWEALSAGPCSTPGPPADSARRTSRCLYIGDVGDNDANRDSVHIYQLAEPRAQGAGFIDTLRARRLTFRYEDEPHDVEAMYVTADGTVHLVTKRALRAWHLKLRPSLVFRIPASAWKSDEPVVAKLADSLPIVPGSALQRTITDASISADGLLLAARTYRQVYIMAVDPVTHAVSQAPPKTCNVFSLEERQGEGLAWFGSTRLLLLTSEGQNEPMHLISCPMP